MGCGASSSSSANVVQPAQPQESTAREAAAGDGGAEPKHHQKDNKGDAGGSEHNGDNGPEEDAPKSTAPRPRRAGVSAQTVSAEDRKNFKKPVYEKDELTKEMLLDIIKTNERLQVLFGNLDEDGTTDVIMAMYARSFNPGEILIKQGDEGDAFWIVESGQYDIYVYRPSKDGSKEPEKQPDGSPPLGDKVLSCTKGACFGELALMYNAPRAATVKCTEAGKAWGLDRESFQMMVTTAESTKKKKYEDFLTSVPILKDLNHFEIAQLSDMLDAQDHKSGDVLMMQGDAGDNFYILESGEAKACLTGEDGNEVVAKVYNTPGDYFGELALLTSAPRRATVYASGNGCRVLALSKDKFDRVLGPIKPRLQAKMNEYPQYAEIIKSQGDDTPKATHPEADSMSDLGQSDDDEEEAPKEQKTKLDVLLQNDPNAPKDLGSVKRRRSGVSAPQVTQYEAEHWEKPVFDKTPEEKDTIAKMIQDNPKLQVLFGHLQPDAVTDIIMAMYPKSVETGTDVIKQGDDGDAFYIVAEGSLHVHVRRPGEAESTKGAKVLELGPGSLFGELALLYNAPRAATVTAVKDSKLWALDAESFRLMLRTAQAVEPKENEEFVHSCEAFAKLNRFERAELSTALERDLFDAEEVFAQEGETADRMFILEDGEAVAFDKDNNAHNRDKLNRVVKRFRGMTYAKSTKSTMSVRMRLWSKLADGIGVPVVPLSAYGVETICSVLRAAGYRSAINYLNSAITHNRDKGHTPDASTEAAIKRARMACKRNLGPPKRMRGISLQELRTLSRKLNGLHPKHRMGGYLLASWFLLRCSELLALNMEHLVFDEAAKIVSVTIASSKVDQAGFGCVRSHGCLCSKPIDPDAAICPFHVIWHLVLTRKRQRASDSSPLMISRKGEWFQKKEFLDCFREDARSCGLAISENDKLGTHSFRRGGVQLLASSGAASRDQLKRFGRWSSDCIDRYLEDVLISDSHMYAARAVRQDSVFPATGESAGGAQDGRANAQADSVSDNTSCLVHRCPVTPPRKKSNWFAHPLTGWIRSDLSSRISRR
ncbi:hypothetical protein FOL47_010392 [Perkinsus chesapeaki]|uniref:Cyclic nucleotide-binding domain-containing protein n=1 Tax=Perkinsus chesapeaki TaxID=330153 RepID=A0A7J6MPT0_PERCH|nr:hypothetical protein FOL47_010392 [Perkinsus chesapeaki]